MKTSAQTWGLHVTDVPKEDFTFIHFPDSLMNWIRGGRMDPDCTTEIPKNWYACPVKGLQS